MKALILKRYGGLDPIAFADIPRPTLKPDEILVQVRAAGLNPIDYMIPKGTFKPMLKFQLPATLGRDVAGVVVEGLLRLFGGWAYVESANNPVDITGFGGANRRYRVRQREVSNRDWAEFLNSVGTEVAERLGLFDLRMESWNGGGIRRGGPGEPVYVVKPGMEARPVVFVSWFDAARFANWQHNRLGLLKYWFDALPALSKVNTGAYTLTGTNAIPDNVATVMRNPNALYFIPSENEWYKSAYFNPFTGTYSAYPTRNNAAPVAQPPPGGGNSANMFPANVGLQNVGSYPNSYSWFGLYDLAGNADEWVEDRYLDPTLLYGVFRGGYWNSDTIASRRDRREPGADWSYSDDVTGFCLGGRSD